MADQEDFRALARAFRAAANGLPQFGRTVSSKLGNNAIGDIEGRIRRKGLKADGSSVGDYSPGYLAYKKRKGRYKGHVDLDLTGRMWGNTGVTQQAVNGTGGFLVIIAGRSAETQKKLDDNSARFGLDVLELSDAEAEELVLDFDDELVLYLESKGL